MRVPHVFAEKKRKVMAVNLNQKAINPHAPALRQMMTNLQGNILKSHGREHTRHIFFSFGADVEKNKRLVKSLVPFLTSSAKQFKSKKRVFTEAEHQSIFGNFFLSARGYGKLGFSRQEVQTAFPENSATGLPVKFTDGMIAAQGELNDPAPTLWEKTYKSGEIDAMVLLASDNNNAVKKAAGAVRDIINRTGRILGEEEGRGLRDEKGRAIENFGYVDGRSQPLYVKSDLDAENTKRDGTDVWDPSAPLALVLVPDPFAHADDSFGSFFVFRKLEQNVKKFKDAEETLGKALKFSGEDEERAGALIIGRFEDGSPLVLHKSPAGHQEAENNFTYANDPDGLRCPFHAHIRKTNPRGDTVRQFGVSQEDENSHRLTRRGITYGHRLTKKFQDDRGKTFEGLDEEKEKRLRKIPTKDVGLLFMCFQANIADQFGFMQKQWANNSNFARPGTGIDPVMGQPVAVNDYNWPAGYGEPRIGKPQFQVEPFAGAVTMKGGEFFFAPSLSFLKGLA
jgi:Dyp-type peroxidase family